LTAYALTRVRSVCIVSHSLHNVNVSSFADNFLWDTSLLGHYPNSSLRPLQPLPRPIPALSASGVPPFTLEPHTSLLHRSIRVCFAKTCVFSDSPGCSFFSSFSSMQSETPGGCCNACLNALPHFVCARIQRIDGTPPYNPFGATFLIQSYFPFTSLNSPWFLRIVSPPKCYRMTWLCLIRGDLLVSLKMAHCQVNAFFILIFSFFI